MGYRNKILNTSGLRVIKTARDSEHINQAARKGLRPLVRKVEPSAEIRSKYSVFQNKKTGEIKVIVDYRALHDNNADFEKIIDWTYYYPHTFQSPFAAYLIPPDIRLGERVFIEDLIEDLIGATWNQGDVYRLKSCEAIWNGSDLEIQYDPRKYRSDYIG